MFPVSLPNVASLDSEQAERWCKLITQGLECQHIQRNGQPYLIRYFLAGWSPMTKRPGPSLFLHHFLASDAYDQVHSHPWGWSASLILVGGYREHRCKGPKHIEVKEYRPGDVNVLLADDHHRIELLADDCWTLFLAGMYAQPWTFAPTCE